MTPTGQDIGLSKDEFALYFQGAAGIDAAELGAFLQRAAVAARRAGSEIKVVGIEPGSLIVKLSAVTKSKLYRNAKKEFLNKPLSGAASIATTATAAVVGAVAAISWAFNDPEPTPLAKAGADVVEKSQVCEINIITVDQSSILINEAIAREVRRKERAQTSGRRIPIAREVLELSHGARRGTLTGGTLEVDGEPHFRPDGYRYLVPIETGTGVGRELFLPGHYRVKGDLRMRDGQPDSIIIFSADRI